MELEKSSAIQAEEAERQCLQPPWTTNIRQEIIDQHREEKYGIEKIQWNAESIQRQYVRSIAQTLDYKSYFCQDYPWPASSTF